MIELFTAVIVFDLGWPPFVGKFDDGFEADSDVYYHTPSGSFALFVACESMAA